MITPRHAEFFTILHMIAKAQHNLDAYDDAVAWQGLHFCFLLYHLAVVCRDMRLSPDLVRFIGRVEHRISLSCVLLTTDSCGLSTGAHDASMPCMLVRKVAHRAALSKGRPSHSSDSPFEGDYRHPQALYKLMQGIIDS